MELRPRRERNPSPDGGAAPVCLNCSAPLKGAYCSECGQAASTGRLRLPQLVRDFAGHMVSLDFGFLRTCLALLRRPGPFLRDYLRGRRVRYANPLSYYLLAVALNVASAALFGHAAVSPVKLDLDGSFWERNFVAIQVGLILTLLMLPLAAMRRVLHRRDGYSVAEHLAALLFVLAQCILIFLVLQCGLWVAGQRLSSGQEGLAFMATFTAYVLWASRSWIAEGFGYVVLKLLTSYGVILVGIVGLGVVLKTLSGQ
jgi:hypothetical protein